MQSMLETLDPLVSQPSLTRWSAKVLADRLKGVMDSITSPFQNVFIEGRQILDPIFIANEAVEDYRAKKKKGWILKLDLEKAFDRVDWGFLEKVLHCKKFSQKWISWIMGCIKNTRFSIFINGKPRGRIVGIQGEFVKGFLVGKDRTHIPILQYADDTILFCKDDESMLIKLKETINRFEWCSGQKVNWKKSALSRINLGDDELSLMAGKLGCKMQKLPFLYLGLPLGGYPRQKLFWQPVVDRVYKKLDR
ncbi:hypothetical protein E5676_scaffold163G00940 [Cucumis melo var. makuwa]|uniref:Reverse transcriptase domain-containing protein n=1 Tax=Cucumis melo var. makuwa TaxID=1194695 RepID=A0A5D3C3J5_CUCMM|nr:hypothetical protein E5676_scaffold163G00940 [Cucumis melo var. makuwa]